MIDRYQGGILEKEEKKNRRSDPDPICTYVMVLRERVYVQMQRSEAGPASGNPYNHGSVHHTPTSMSIFKAICSRYEQIDFEARSTKGCRLPI